MRCIAKSCSDKAFHPHQCVVCLLIVLIVPSPRNPDNDSTPWCYVYKGTQIVWEFCSMPKCPKGTALQKPIYSELKYFSLNHSLLYTWVSSCALEQIGTTNVCWARVSHTEAQHLSLRAALAVCPGTLLLLNASSTMPGDLMHWSRGWAATASAGRYASTIVHVQRFPFCMRKD